MLRLNLIAIILSLVLCVDISAKSMDKEFLVLKASLEKVGTAKFSVLFWDIYQSELYSSSGRYKQGDQQQILFIINYNADITKNDLLERTIEQWQHLDIPKNTYQQFVPLLNTIWPDIKKGDSLAINVVDDKSQFYFNQQYIGLINDKMFGDIFLDIWLSENTSQPKLRQNLLGENNNVQ